MTIRQRIKALKRELPKDADDTERTAVEAYNAALKDAIQAIRDDENERKLARVKREADRRVERAEASGVRVIQVAEPQMTDLLKAANE